MKVIKNIFSVVMTNIINFGTSFLINFMLPIILSVIDYGNYRQYMLYMNFTYLFNLGFNDGIYIKYGGKEDQELNRKEVHEEHNFIFLFQLVVFGLMLLYSGWQESIIYVLFSIATFFNAVNVYHQNLLQATGKFTIFSRANILKSLFYVVILIIGIFIFQYNNYINYIIINILTIVFLFIFYEYHFIKKYGFNMRFNFKGKFEIFWVGIFILSANISLTFVGNIGSWIVNWRYPIENFAQYSFQNSVLNVILLVVNAVGMVFYNYISKRRDEILMNIIKNVSILLGIGAGLIYFVFKVIIQQFLPDYINAISLLSITFIAVPYIMITKILVANLYKTTVSEYKYFRDSILYAVGSLVFVLLADIIFGNMQAIALATTLCYVTWYLYTSRVRFNYLKGSLGEIIVLISHFIVFLITANYFSTSIGFIIYLIYYIVLLLFNKTTIKQMIQMVAT